MDLVFCGTPQFAVPTLEALRDAGHRIQFVVCQPDRPRGRGQQLAPPEVKQRALDLGLEVAQPGKIKTNDEFRSRLEELTPDAIIVVAYGRMIPRWMMDLPRFGNLNLHASLLPKYRGAAPIQWAIANGEQSTGVTTMRIDEGLDTGDILLQQAIPISPDDTAVTLAPRLAETGARLMAETLRQLEKGDLKPSPQDNSQATHAPLLSKDDGRIDFSHAAQVIVDRMRGFQPWPGAYTAFRGKNLKITDGQVAGSSANVPQPGTIHITNQRLFVGCGDRTVLEVIELQPEGKKRMNARAFIHGYRPQNGEAVEMS